MIEVRFHGRGGQGTALACDMLALALLKDGKWAQSFPLFGAERRGAPVTAFLRVNDKRIFFRGEIYEPDHIVVLDSALTRTLEVTTGLKIGGWVVINSPLKPDAFKFPQEFRVASVDANAIAAKHGLGSTQARIVNTAILGALTRVTGLVSLNCLIEAIREAVPMRKDENADAALEAYEVVCIGSFSH